MNAATLTIDFIANVARITQDMAQINSVVTNSMGGINSAIAAAKRGIEALGVTLSLGALVIFSDRTLTAIGRMKDLGQEAGTTAEGISKFEEPALKAGASLDDVAGAMFKMGKAAKDAKDPANASAIALKSIGISTSDLKGLKPDQMFELIARQLEGYSDGLGKNAVLQQLFGKSGKEMNGIMHSIAEQSQLTASVTNEQAEAAKKLEGQMVELKMTGDKFWRSLVSDAVPGLTDVLKAFMQARTEGGLFQGLIQGLATAFENLNGKSLADQLKQVNEQIATAKRAADIQGGKGGVLDFNTQANADVAAKMNGLLQQRANIEHLIFQQELDAQSKRALGGLKAKPDPNFDPAAIAAAKAAEQEYQGLNAQILAEIANLSGVGEMEAFITKLEEARFSKLSADQLAELLTNKQRLIDLKNEAAARALLIESDRALLGAMQALSDLQADAITSGRAETDQMQFEITLLGKSQAEIEKLGALRKADMELRRQAAQIPSEDGMSAAGAAALANLIAQNDARKKGIVIIAGEKDATQQMLQAVSDIADAWTKAGADISDALTKAFGEAGKNAGDVFKAYSDGVARQAEIDKKFLADRDSNGAHSAAQTIKYQQDIAANSLKQYGDMADAAKGFFSEGSRGYAALGAVSKVFHIAEMAMELEQLGVKAVSAILTQGQGDPYSAFVRMAAMAAIVAALLAGVGASMSGGASAPNVSAQRQASQGTGTVLGDDTSKSDSIKNALDLILADSDQELTYQSSMTASLVSIDSAMQSLAKAIAKTLGVANPTSALFPGLNLGTTPNTPGIISALGLLPNGPLNNAINNLFLGHTTTNVSDTGIHIPAQTVGAAVQNFLGQYFADVTTTRSGGIFGSLFGGSGSSTSTQYSPFDQSTASDFTRFITAVTSSIAQAVDILSGKAGPDLTAFSRDVSAFINGLNIPELTVSLQGLKGQDLVDALEHVFSQMSDTLAQQVIEQFAPGVQAFQQVGEGLFQTLIRVANGAEQAKSILGNLGIAMIDWTAIINKTGDVATELVRQSIVATEMIGPNVLTGVGEIIQNFQGTAQDLAALYQKLLDVRFQLRAVGTDATQLGMAMIQGAGGLTALSRGLDAFSSNFFTTAERLIAQRGELDTAFAKLNLALPTSLAGFRSLVESIDLSTDAGKTLYGQLIALAPAFASVQQAAAGMVSTFNQIMGQLRPGFSASATQSQLTSDLAAFQRTGHQWAAGMTTDQLLQQILTITPEDFANYVKNDPNGAALINSILGGYASLQGGSSSAGGGSSGAGAFSDAINALAAQQAAAAQAAKDLAAALTQAKVGIGDYLSSLLLDKNLSPLSPAEQQAEAQRKFFADVTAAQGGDLGAMGRLQGDSQTYLGLARDNLGSSSAYVDIFQSVFNAMASVAGVDDYNTRMIGIQSQQRDTLLDIKVLLQDIAYGTTPSLAASGSVQAPQPERR